MYTLILLAYLLGSINSAILICRCMRLPSPLTTGSGNPGATNVLRLGNKKAAALTLLGDILKGVFPVSIGHLMHLPSVALAWITLFAVLGHLYPVFFSFKGGKGVATALGGLFALFPILGLCVIASWLLVFAVTRTSSLSSMIAIGLSPIFGVFLLGLLTLPPLLLMAIFILARHRHNLSRLLAGTESKIRKAS